MKLYIYLIALVVLISCKERSESIAKLKPFEIKIDTTKISLVDQIAQCNRVDGQYTGISGSESMQYKRYKILTTYTDEQLRELINHNNAVVRIYAFDALAERNSSLVIKAFENKISDTASFDELGGCIVTTKKVNVYLYSYIKNKLTSNQRKLYLDKLSTIYSKKDLDYYLNGF